MNQITPLENGNRRPFATHNHLLWSSLYLWRHKHAVFSEESFLRKHGTALGMKIAVPFANIFMAEIEKKLIQQLKRNQTKKMETLH